MTTKILRSLLLITCISLQAQTISLEFPYFAGQTYEFKIFQGERQIILREDTIAKGGKVQLTVPNQYKEYKGIAQWYLTNSKTGGGLDLIINGENFSVSCLDSMPTNANILFKNTIENISDREKYQHQQRIFEKHDAVLSVINAYPPRTELYKLALDEYETLLKEYADFSKSLSSSTMYSAKFRQIVNLTRGIGSIINPDEKKRADNINIFMVDELDYQALYTSNHWSGLISYWVQLQTTIFKDDEKMISDIETILKRIPNRMVYTDYVAALTKALSKTGKDNVIESLKNTITAGGKLLNFAGSLSVYQLDLSGKAPDLVISSSAEQNAANNGRVLKTDNLKSKYSLLFFFESGCGFCEDAIEDLKKNYAKLASKKLKIITLSADIQELVYKKTTADFPWTDNYCDFKGINGANFKNYGVIGTPTMFLLDCNGKIIKKIAVIKELITWIESQQE